MDWLSHWPRQDVATYCLSPVRVMVICGQGSHDAWNGMPFFMTHLQTEDTWHVIIAESFLIGPWHMWLVTGTRDVAFTTSQIMFNTQVFCSDTLTMSSWHTDLLLSHIPGVDHLLSYTDHALSHLDDLLWHMDHPLRHTDHPLWHIDHLLWCLGNLFWYTDHPLRHMHHLLWCLNNLFCYTDHPLRHMDHPNWQWITLNLLTPS